MGILNATQIGHKPNSVLTVTLQPQENITPRRRRFDWRRVVGIVGMTLVISGLFLLGLVAYQLWGTGIQAREAQKNLEKDFAALTSSTTSTTTIPTSVSPTSTTPEVFKFDPPEEGSVIARMTIPRMDLDVFVVEGVKYNDLRLGPGHYSDSPLFGQNGNVAVAGHRTTYGAPFGDIDKLAKGDLINVQTVYGAFTYEVTGSEIVEPTRVDVVANKTPEIPTLTLTACHPKYSAAKRYIVYSKLVPNKSTSVIVETEPTKPTNSAGKNDEAFSEGWWHDSSAWPHVAFWGTLVVLVVVAVLLISKRYTGRIRGIRWISIGLFALPFIVFLYFFYENLSRLLPTNL